VREGDEKERLDPVDVYSDAHAGGAGKRRAFRRLSCVRRAVPAARRQDRTRSQTHKGDSLL